MTQLIATSISHSFPGGSDLFSGFSMDVSAGEMVALTGPSGSGKSTLLHILAGWQKPTRGSVEWIGIRSIGWVFQNPFGSSRRSALDHVVLPLLSKGVDRRDAELIALAAMDRFNLDQVANRPFANLSGGEAQRLMLARSVVTAPDLLMVDEPTAQLDRSTAETVNSVLAEIADKKTIVLVATHDSQTRDSCHRELSVSPPSSGA